LGLPTGLLTSIMSEDNRAASSAHITTKANPTAPRFDRNQRAVADLVAQVRMDEEQIQLGGGAKAIDAQHAKGRMTARERIARLIDAATEFFELGSYAAWGMYEEWGGAPSAGGITGLAHVQGRRGILLLDNPTREGGGVFSL